ncbi:MAG: YlqD family protein [Armatimonadetes bacterium]|nr:YlqD family protein [Armatimonadota bacterium]
MLVKRRVIIKAVVTEKFKKQLISQLEQALQEVKRTQQQIETQGMRYLAELEGRDPTQAVAFARKLERQKRKQEAVRARLDEELSKVRMLELGAEHPQGTVEGLVEINIGDNINEKLCATELIVEDGFVKEIRNP